MQRTHKYINQSNKHKKGVAMATLVAIYCQETSQLQSMQGYGMQRTHKNVYLYRPKKQKKVLS